MRFMRVLGCECFNKTYDNASYIAQSVGKSSWSYKIYIKNYI